MQIEKLPLPGLFLITPKVFGDERGFFFESFNARDFARLVGFAPDFVQDNHSRSAQGVLRGLHYQIRQAQGKLVRVISGAVFDVAADLRRASPTFGKWFGVVLSAENKRQFWIPPGFAHGFYTLTETAEFIYKTTDYYAPEHERCVAWNDPDLRIEWPLKGAPTLSAKDQQGLALQNAETFD